MGDADLNDIYRELDKTNEYLRILVKFAEKLEPVLDYAIRMINKSPGKRIREAMNRHGSGS